ncbi:MAG: hypothetical protein CHKLHMKO_00684 [Candidatus Argoarchaeum ethanivorans]|uniref:Uncharacterized protein n=1 Tax=Candidatus Argoarchaeum ethanivorans TaxID=2608793 RepID=A0A811THK3_9EURY|nr:MAG: hypothetical protein CHKLHMKO_00684 [Candidatus Argoarchaeum ethanivorans]
MVDWKNVRLKYDANTKSKIAAHHVRLEEIYEVFQDYFMPRKKIVQGGKNTLSYCNTNFKW